MANTFFIADTHIGHIGVTQFLNSDGTKLRPWDNIEDMDEALVANWNSVVGSKDKVYHLGDVVINRRALPTLARLNGDKVLIKGNHDIFRLEEYARYFRDIRAYGVFDGFVATHIPIHPYSLERYKFNVHGHLHSDKVLHKEEWIDESWYPASPDTRYLCVSVEQINYTPISIEEVRQILKERG